MEEESVVTTPLSIRQQSILDQKRKLGNVTADNAAAGPKKRKSQDKTPTTVGQTVRCVFRATQGRSEQVPSVPADQ